MLYWGNLEENVQLRSKRLECKGMIDYVHGKSLESAIE